MLTGDFDYRLPSKLIAQTPLEPRDSSRLLVLGRATGSIEHRSFRDILEYLRPGDVMVFNQSRVIPARLQGYRMDTGGKVELLLLHQDRSGDWQALARPGRRLRAGMKVIVPPPAGRGTVEGFQVEILDSHPDGIKTVRLAPGAEIGLLGQIPLPPYIHERLDDPERYQTVYAMEPGSAAAPTAGLHFTTQLMDVLRDSGVELAFVSLHVGLDTFRPVHGEDPTKHRIHTERFEISPETADVLNLAREDGRRVIAVGTTTVRVLEQAGQMILRTGIDLVASTSGQADLYILPGHRFLVVDAMITNFHLPKSTLLMLVSAFAGRDRVLQTYQEAIEQEYRFYSFGDAMLIV